MYPFKNLFDTDNINDKKYFINFLKDINFYYTPQNINFSSSYVDSDNLTVQRDLYGGIITDERNIDLNRSLSSNINIIDNLSFQYSVNMKNNLNDYFSKNSNMKISDFFDLSYSPGIKKSFNQQLSFTYTPEYLNGLVHDLIMYQLIIGLEMLLVENHRQLIYPVIIDFQFHLLFHLPNLLNSFMNQIKKHLAVLLGLLQEDDLVVLVIVLPIIKYL